MKRVISLFDGMSCCQIALNRLGVKDFEYYASEIEVGPIAVTQHNFPKTIQVGDVRNFKVKHIEQVFLVTGGSPCQSFSFAGKQKGMVTTTNIEITSLKQYLKLKKEGFEFEGQSYLFWEFVRVVRESKTKYFLLENVLMAKKWEEVISRELGVLPIHINSNLVSGQNRDRLYWTNIPNVSQPKDKNITFDTISGGKGAGHRGVWNNELGKYVRRFTVRQDGKSNCLVTTPSSTNLVQLPNGKVRLCTIEECEVLQTVPVGYTDVPGISKTARYKMLGNGWTVDVIKHILKNIVKKRELVEELS
jgi:site-specific DNA-cytosine methylase